VSSHQAVGTKIAHLLAGLAGDVDGEDCLQPPLGLAVLLPRIDLLHYKAGICVGEGLGEVRPYPIAAEAGDARLSQGVSLTCPSGTRLAGRSPSAENRSQLSAEKLSGAPKSADMVVRGASYPLLRSVRFALRQSVETDLT
jgi:hypothetical protein